MKHLHKAAPAVYLILQKGEKILLARRQNTGYMDGYWHVPAGHVDPDELPRDSMVREAAEEIGITIDSAWLEPVHISYRTASDETGDRVDFFFRATQWIGEISNREPDKCSELKWVYLDRLPRNITPYVRHAIQCIQQGKIYSEPDKEIVRTNRNRNKLQIHSATDVSSNYKHRVLCGADARFGVSRLKLTPSAHAVSCKSCLRVMFSKKARVNISIN